MLWKNWERGLRLMASRKKTCDFCGKRCIKEDMIPHKDKLLCDTYCETLFIEAYESDEVKKK